LTDTPRLYTPVFFLGFVFNFVIALHFTNNAMYPLFVTGEGGGAAMVGLFMGVYSISGVLGRPAIALLIERYGPRIVLIIGSLCMSLPAACFIALIGHGAGPVAFVLRVVQGFGYGAHFSATFTLAGRLAPPSRRNEAVAMYGVSGLAGGMIGPVIAEWLIHEHGLAAFFAAMTGVGIVAAAIISRISLPPNASERFPRPAEVFAAFRAPEMRLPAMLAFLFAMTFSTPVSFLATFAHSHGIEKFSFYFLSWGFAGILIRFIGGRWGDNLGLRRVLIPGLFFYSIGMVIVFFSRGVAGLVTAGVFAGIAHGISFPAVTSLGYSLAPKGFAGSAMALVTGMMDAGAAFTALAVGTCAEMWGYDIVFPIAAGSSLAAMIILIGDIRKAPTLVFEKAGVGYRQEPFSDNPDT
jgi:MFS family permease